MKLNSLRKRNSILLQLLLFHNNITGSLPSVDDGVVTRRVCTRTFNDFCEDSWNIDIKNCTDYNVYNLKTSERAKSAYCFGEFDQLRKIQTFQNLNSDWPKRLNLFFMVFLTICWKVHREGMKRCIVVIPHFLIFFYELTHLKMTDEVVPC